MLRDQQSIQDIWNAAQEILSFTAGMEYEALVADRRTQLHQCFCPHPKRWIRLLHSRRSQMGNLEGGKLMVPLLHPGAARIKHQKPTS